MTINPEKDVKDTYSNYESYCRKGSLTDVMINNNTNLTPDQHLAVLKRIRNSIDSEPVSKVDSNHIGNKELSCNWGMCSTSTDHYPYPELHTFPKDFVESGRSSPLSGAKGYDCPMRERSANDTESERLSGCYHQCRIFQRRFRTPTRIEALELYDAEIERIEYSNGNNKGKP